MPERKDDDRSFPHFVIEVIPDTCQIEAEQIGISGRSGSGVHTGLARQERFGFLEVDTDGVGGGGPVFGPPIGVAFDLRRGSAGNLDLKHRDSTLPAETLDELVGGEGLVSVGFRDRCP